MAIFGSESGPVMNADGTLPSPPRITFVQPANEVKNPLEARTRSFLDKFVATVRGELERRIPSVLVGNSAVIRILFTKTAAKITEILHSRGSDILRADPLELSDLIDESVTEVVHEQFSEDRIQEAKRA